MSESGSSGRGSTMDVDLAPQQAELRGLRCQIATLGFVCVLLIIAVIVALILNFVNPASNTIIQLVGNLSGDANGPPDANVLVPINPLSVVRCGTGQVQNCTDGVDSKGRCHLPVCVFVNDPNTTVLNNLTCPNATDVPVCIQWAATGICLLSECAYLPQLQPNATYDCPDPTTIAVCTATDAHGACTQSICRSLNVSGPFVEGPLDNVECVPSGVVPGTYGGNGSVPVLTLGLCGTVTSATTAVPISATNVTLIGTADEVTISYIDANTVQVGQPDIVRIGSYTGAVSYPAFTSGLRITGPGSLDTVVVDSPQLGFFTSVGSGNLYPRAQFIPGADSFFMFFNMYRGVLDTFSSSSTAMPIVFGFSNGLYVSMAEPGTPAGSSVSPPLKLSMTPTLTENVNRFVSGSPNFIISEGFGYFALKADGTNASMGIFEIYQDGVDVPTATFGGPSGPSGTALSFGMYRRPADSAWHASRNSDPGMGVLKEGNSMLFSFDLSASTPAGTAFSPFSIIRVRPSNHAFSIGQTIMESDLMIFGSPAANITLFSDLSAFAPGVRNYAPTMQIADFGGGLQTITFDGYVNTGLNVIDSTGAFPIMMIRKVVNALQIVGFAPVGINGTAGSGTVLVSIDNAAGLTLPFVPLDMPSGGTHNAGPWIGNRIVGTRTSPSLQQFETTITVEDLENLVGNATTSKTIEVTNTFRFIFPPGTASCITGSTPPANAGPTPGGSGYSTVTPNVGNFRVSQVGNQVTVTVELLMATVTGFSADSICGFPSNFGTPNSLSRIELANWNVGALLDQFPPVPAPYCFPYEDDMYQIWPDNSAQFGFGSFVVCVNDYTINIRPVQTVILSALFPAIISQQPYMQRWWANGATRHYRAFTFTYIADV